MSFKDGLAADTSSVFFNAQEFCTPILHADGDSVCYFDEQWSELTGGEAGVSVHTPTALVSLSLMPSIDVGDTVTIVPDGSSNGDDYIIRDLQLDRGQTGDVLLILSEP